jgi:hypothetical protein
MFLRMPKLKDTRPSARTPVIGQVKPTWVLRVRKLRVGVPGDCFGHDHLDGDFGVIRQITIMAYDNDTTKVIVFPGEPQPGCGLARQKITLPRSCVWRVDFVYHAISAR